MKIIVFGATGDTGRPLIKQLLSNGHEVTAIVRTPSKLELSGKQLEVIKGDVLNPSTFEGKINETDAVISVIGGNQRSPTTVYSEGMKNIIREMKQGEVSRLICLSAETLKSKKESSFTERILLKVLWGIFHHLYSDMQLMEEEIYNSHLDWTIIRPPYLTNGKPKGRYQISVNHPVKKSKGRISRGDLATAIINQLRNNETVYRIIYVSAR